MLTKPKRPGKSAAPPEPALTTQRWVPVRDLHDGCLFRPDGAVVAGIRLRAPALGLKSALEQGQLIQGLQAALDGIGCPWQIWTSPRPIDLDAYLAALDIALQGTPTGPRRRVLGDYLRWVSGLVRQGEAVERRSHILMSRVGPDAVAEHRQAIRGLLDDLSRLRGVEATPLEDADWRQVVFLAFHAGRTAYEPALEERRPIPIYRAPTREKGGEAE